MKRYMKLMEEMSIGSMELKNRIAYPPITTGFGAINGSYSAEDIEFSAERAKGGAALVFTDAVAPTRDQQTPVSTPLPYFDNDGQIAAYARWVDAVHNNGAKTCIQLNNAGRQTTILKRGGKPPMGPSAMSSKMVGLLPFPDAVEMTEIEIEQMILDYVLAAGRAQAAGFDAIDIDGGAGYLIQQFMSPLTNRRKDKWGGSLQNRLRFPLEIIRRTREVVGPRYPLLFDLCMDECAEGGIKPEQALETALMFEEEGIAAFRVHNYNLESYEQMFPTMATRRGINVPFGKMLKDNLKSAKVMLGQRINDPDLAEKILDEGGADILLLGRPLIADPYFPKKVLQNRPKSIRKCIACNHCVDMLGYARPIRCVINPIVGFEKEYGEVVQSANPKSVLVIGGGVGGMEAAKAAADRGHKVVLSEKSDRLGGHIKIACLTPHKEELENIIDYYQEVLPEAGVDVRLNTEIDIPGVKEMAPDVIIQATGSTVIKPGFIDFNLPNVFTPEEATVSPEIVKGDKVAVIGGGAVGIEVAEMLAMQNKQVTVLEMKDAVIEDLGIFLAVELHRRIKTLGLTINTGATVKNVNSNSVTYIDSDGEQKVLQTDAVIVAVGFKPNRDLSEQLKGLSEEFIRIGDCSSPRKILDAVHEGFHAARLLD